MCVLPILNYALFYLHDSLEIWWILSCMHSQGGKIGVKVAWYLDRKLPIVPWYSQLSWTKRYVNTAAKLTCFPQLSIAWHCSHTHTHTKPVFSVYFKTRPDSDRWHMVKGETLARAWNWQKVWLGVAKIHVQGMFRWPRSRWILWHWCDYNVCGLQASQRPPLGLGLKSNMFIHCW